VGGGVVLTVQYCGLSINLLEHLRRLGLRLNYYCGLEWQDVKTKLLELGISRPPLWQALEAALVLLPQEDQLRVAAEAIAQLAEVYTARADALLKTLDGALYPQNRFSALTSSLA
jgi:hypothetical protein